MASFTKKWVFSMIKHAQFFYSNKSYFNPGRLIHDVHSPMFSGDSIPSEQAFKDHLSCMAMGKQHHAAIRV